MRKVSAPIRGIACVLFTSLAGPQRSTIQQCPLFMGENNSILGDGIMRIVIGLILLVLLMGGCMSQQQRIQQREALVARFKLAYPDTWQAELLKYDLEEKQRRSDQWSEALEGMSEAGENARKMRRKIKPSNTIINSNNNSTYWQEKQAQQQYLDSFKPKPVKVEPIFKY